jgi:hypothetical protein
MNWKINFKKIFPYTILELEYAAAGTNFANAVDLGIEKGNGFESMLNSWSSLEKEYSRRGYRTISLNEFLNVECRTSLDNLLGIKRTSGEPRILHAEQYKKPHR